jgi:tRNA pseudouridine55 synthase
MGCTTTPLVAEAPRAQVRRAVDGVLLLDKPLGLTSNAALQAVKRLFRARKAGHTGTLDPLATGLLPILFGEATKFAFLLLESEKAYLARVLLGSTTTTGDAEGAIVERRPVRVAAQDVEQVLAQFRGEIEQLPPMYSALKHAGRPLYEFARAGQHLERKPRRVRIESLELVDLNSECLDIRVRCSKGTYIRTLAEDIGAALGTGAHLGGLRRVATASWRIERAFTLERLAAMGEPERAACLQRPEVLLGELPRITLGATDADGIRHGRACAGQGQGPGRYGIFDPEGGLIGIGEVASDGQLHPRRLLRAAEFVRSAQPAEKHRETL